ncbi:hypothetical protein G3I60_36745 [Streptomyces sp. SID13666]|uniref:hypothetical protein n=1 Tax=unclassified Streptomyces TaxID=2593676 RepID=UPI0013BEE17D|nr:MULTISPECIES: hypothetical protein [unclassified Streptomyces]NEA59562.1 hypothetical protein [Streptomyces sp. SID13666]NEA72712.1 hypothetical protein [Streptomyces sp. SID13588]
MTGELIHVNGNRQVTYDSAVGHITSSLSPLGAAARITATIAACTIEFRRFKLQRGVVSDIITMRQSTIVQIFEEERRQSTGAQYQLRYHSTVIDRMMNMAVNNSLSEEGRTLALQSATLLSGAALQHYVAAGDQLVRLSDSLRLADAEASVVAWRAMQS